MSHSAVGYYDIVAQCIQSLKNFEVCIDKAEKHAAAKEFDVGILMAGRLAPTKLFRPEANGFHACGKRGRATGLQSDRTAVGGIDY